MIYPSQVNLSGSSCLIFQWPWPFHQSQVYLPFQKRKKGKKRIQIVGKKIIAVLFLFEIMSFGFLHNEKLGYIGLAILYLIFNIRLWNIHIRIYILPISCLSIVWPICLAIEEIRAIEEDQITQANSQLNDLEKKKLDWYNKCQS